MIQMLRKRLDRKDEGFTLIELMVVVLIIAILLAIAIPTFLGARSRAQNRSAESNLRNAFTSEKTAYTDGQSYVVASVVQTIEPSLSFLASGTAPTAGNSVEVVPVGTGSVGVCLFSLSGSGNYYGILDVSQSDGSNYTSAGTWYMAPATSPPTCPTGASSGAATGGGGTWSTTTTG